MHKITRTFWPIGQGGFCSEQHVLTDMGPRECHFNIVYDCGTFPRFLGRGQTFLDKCKLVEASLGDEDVNILFISHFHYDHISLIEALKCKRRIRKVVMPLLPRAGAYAILGYYRVFEDELKTLDPTFNVEVLDRIINGPEKFFKTHRISFVRPFQVEDRHVNDEVSHEDDARAKNGQTAPSMKIIRRFANWYFVPFCLDIIKKGITFDSEIETFLTRNNSRRTSLCDGAFVMRHLDELKDIYSRTFKRDEFNQNSLAVYSGPLPETRQQFADLDENPVRPACLYTGDFELDRDNLCVRFSQYLPNIGTTQIPHHGASDHFVANSLPLQGRNCPVVFGTPNTYGHPGLDVELTVKGVCGNWIEVCECPASIYKQIFRSL